MEIGNLVRSAENNKIGIILEILRINKNQNFFACEILWESGEIEDCVWNRDIEVIGEL